MKRAKIYIDDWFCGILTEDPEGYHFKYDSQYLSMPDAKALSPTMPLQEEEYEKEMMFPVFDGLIPEGWELYVNGATSEGAVANGFGASETTSYWIIRKPCTKEEFNKAVEEGISK